MASGWNLLVRLQGIGVVSGFCCKEVYRFPHNITYPYSTCISSFFTEASVYTSSFIFEMCFHYFTKYINALNCMEKQMCSYCPYFGLWIVFLATIFHFNISVMKD